MTKLVQTWEVSAAAETKVEDLFDRVLDKLHWQNQRLAQLVEEIRTAQPMASGSVCLELHPCRPEGCRGCPHGRWVQYHWRPSKTNGEEDILISVNLSAAKRDPILPLPRKAEHFQKTATLIREAKSILSDRAKLISVFRKVEYAAKLNSN